MPEQLAVIRQVRYGVGDYGQPALSFTTYISDCVGAGQFFHQPQADEIILAAGVSDVHALEGMTCWVEVSGCMIRFLRMAKMGK